MPGSPEAMAKTVANFYSALSRKDLNSAIGFCSKDSVFWHNFDAIEQSLEQAAEGWKGLFAAFAENRIDAVKWDPIPGGLVQRHNLLLRDSEGRLKAKPCCIFVSFDGEKISRLEEYIDLSGSLEVTDDERH